VTDDPSSSSAVSIQDRFFPSLTCFGCGPRNDKGLRLKSYLEDGGVVARFTPWPEHDNGLGYLNGGIISTVLDCHSAAVVIEETARRGWARAADGSGEVGLQYVTAGLDVRYLRPTPLHETLLLRGCVLEASEDQVTADVEIVWDGKPRASATALWKRWRPRA
jgi:acyl-coenzyme A thioesterase PaaI-like protein